MANANFLSGLHRARIRYPEIDLDRCKLIGWGAGYMFEKFYPQLGIKLDYTACVWEIESGQIKDGETKCGVPVYHADRLRDENPDEVLIVVFSGKWFDCMRQIPAYGRFRVIRAMDEREEGTGTEHDLQQVFAGPASAAPEHIDDASIGVMVQGPVMAHVTPMVLAANRRKFPFATLVLSTWDDTPAALLDACAPYVDEIVTSPLPAYPGAFNALMQRDNTRAGFVAMARLGVKYAFKTRTDQSIIGNVDVAQLLELARHPIDGKDAGSRERIVFCPQLSWRFVPFHLTDQLQFGRVDDLLEFWQGRDDSFLGYVSLESSAPASHMALCAPESCFVRCYLRRIGVDYELTLASYWQIVADRFALMPETEISILNWKAIALFDVPVLSDPRARAFASPANLMSIWHSADWRELRGHRKSFEKLADRVERIGLTVADYVKATPFDVPVSNAANGASR